MLKQSFHRFLLPGLVAGLSLTMIGCPFAGGGPAFIQDAALESAIRAELGKPLGILTQDDLLQVTEVTARGLNIATLNGIEGLRNLTVLDVRSNNIRSITPLQNLVNLRVLDLGDNQVSQISALSGLFLLEEVNLSGANMDIVDWSPLAANATNGGLGAGDTVILPVNTTLDTDGQILPHWEEEYRTLVDLGVNVLFGETGTDEGASGA